MTDFTNLKMEARRLLDEVNQNPERSPGAAGISYWPYSEKISEQYSFKERLKSLKQKVQAFSAQNLRVK